MTWLLKNLPLVEELLLTHLLLSLVPVVVGLVVALPLGRFAFRHPALGAPLLGGAGILYAIPSLPLLIMIPTVFGTPLRSAATMTIALTVYAAALLIRTAADAFASVPDPVRQSATAIGFSSWARFWPRPRPSVSSRSSGDGAPRGPASSRSTSPSTTCTGCWPASNGPGPPRTASSASRWAPWGRRRRS